MLAQHLSLQVAAQTTRIDGVLVMEALEEVVNHGAMVAYYFAPWLVVYAQIEATLRRCGVRPDFSLGGLVTH